MLELLDFLRHETSASSEIQMTFHQCSFRFLVSRYGPNYSKKQIIQTIWSKNTEQSPISLEQNCSNVALGSWLVLNSKADGRRGMEPMRDPIFHRRVKSVFKLPVALDWAPSSETVLILYIKFESRMDFRKSVFGRELLVLISFRIVKCNIKVIDWKLTAGDDGTPNRIS